MLTDNPLIPGSAAAIAINSDLVEDDVRNAVREFEHGFLPSSVR